MPRQAPWFVLSEDGNGYRPRVRTTVQCVAWSPDGSMLASASTSSDVVVTVWDAASGDAKYTLQCGVFRGISVAWSPDGRLLVTGSTMGTLTLWAMDKGIRVRLMRRALHLSDQWPGALVGKYCWQHTGVTIFNVSEFCQ